MKISGEKNCRGFFIENFAAIQNCTPKLLHFLLTYLLLLLQLQILLFTPSPPPQQKITIFNFSSWAKEQFAAVLKKV